MAQATTIATLTSVMKDAWTAERIQKQFYNLNPLIKMIRDAPGVTVMGLQAQVPIHSRHTSGYTSTNAAGGVLNPATTAATAQATFTMVYHYMQIGLELAVLNQTNTSAQSIIAGKDLEMKDSVDFMSRMASQQLARDGTGILAELATKASNVVMDLRPPTDGVNGHGQGAIVRGHIQPDMLVDIGTLADTDALATGVPVTAVDDSVTAPTVTTGTAVATTAGTHFIFVANPNSATLANPVSNGLANIAGNNLTFGGINPATAGNEYWKPAKVDATTTSFSMPLALDLQRAVFQKDGTYDAKVFTSAKQMANFYMELQNQVRFPSERAMGAGGVGGLVGLDWNGTGVNVLPDIYDSDWFHIRIEDLVMVRGSIKEPTWMSDIEGAGGDVRWVQGTTGFGNGVVWPWQIGAQRRNRMAAATNLQT